VNEGDFLSLVKQRGSYRSEGEASRAANAVFGTIKGWLTPGASDRLRTILPRDASLLWQYSPVMSMAAALNVRQGEGGVPIGPRHFIFRVQQLGGYSSLSDARRASCSVLRALAGTVSEKSATLFGQMFPEEILGNCAGDVRWVA